MVFGLEISQLGHVENKMSLKRPENVKAFQKCFYLVFD